MKRKETTAIALKCFAIYILVQLIISLPTLTQLGVKFEYWSGQEANNALIFSIPFFSVALGIGAFYLLWRTSNSVLEKESSSSQESEDLGVDGVMKIILSCMGVYFVIDAAMILPYAFVNFQIARSVPDSQVLLSFMNLVTQILEITFGSLLIAKSSKWVKMIREIARK